MTRHLVFSTLLGAVVMVVLFFAGRVSRHCPAPALIEAQQERVEDSWRSMVADVETHSTSTIVAGPERVVTRWLRPTGTVAKETTIERGGTTSTSTTGSTSKTAEAVRTEVIEKTAIKVVAAPVQRWGIGVAGGIDLQGNRTWGIAGSYQMMEHVRATIVAQPQEKSVMGIVEVAF